MEPTQRARLKLKIQLKKQDYAIFVILSLIVLISNIPQL